MNQLNPNAVAIWIFGASVGYCCGGDHGAALGLAITSGLSFILSVAIGR
jgi:hypothetical protein